MMFVEVLHHNDGVTLLILLLPPAIRILILGSYVERIPVEGRNIILIFVPKFELDV